MQDSVAGIRKDSRPSGLIHSPLAAAAMPVPSSLQLDDILDATRDYDHYEEFYRPFVIEVFPCCS
jgi:hypothetical protein